MTEPFAISKSKEPRTGEDYQVLLQEGLILAQQFSKKYWTDFNEHDPGLTILEVLSYLVTELSYKANLPVESLLANEQGKIDYRKAGFFKPKEILPSAPVTVSDFVKIILDRFPEVLNAAIIAGDNTGLPVGKYKVLVAVDPDTEKDPGNALELCSAIKRFLNRNRSLCEFFDSVEIYKGNAVTLTMTIGIDRYADANKILAKIYKGINDYLLNPARFYSAAEMISEGYTVDEIYSGPLLENGFLPGEILPPLTSFDPNDFIRIIFAVEGVVEVTGLKMDRAGIQEPASGQAFYIDIQKSVDRATVTSGKMKQAVDPNAITLEYQLLSKKNGAKNKNNTIENKKQIKKISGVDSYSTIQNDFPPLYGISEHGLPVYTDIASGNIRKGKAKQLQAYLLHFEQLAANFMIQVKQTREVFSNSPLAPTYYSQPLYGVKGIQALVNMNADNIPRFRDEYKNYLEELDSTFDDVEERRNRMLNHLLARYNYALDNIPEKSSGYRISTNDKLKIKSGFVSALPVFSNRRSSAYIQEGFYSGSTMELTLKHLLGLKKGTTLSTARVKELVEKEYAKNKDAGLLLLNEPSTDELEAVYKMAGNVSNYSISPVEGELCASILVGKKEVLRISDVSLDSLKRKVYEFANWMDKLFLKFDNFYVIENLLFSNLQLPGQVVALADTTCDFYQMHITFLFPAFTGKFSSPEFTAFVEKEIMTLCPAHINFTILYLTLADYMEAERLMPSWKAYCYGEQETDIKTTGALLQGIILKDPNVSKLYTVKSNRA